MLQETRLLADIFHETNSEEHIEAIKLIREAEIDCELILGRFTTKTGLGDHPILAVDFMDYVGVEKIRDYINRWKKWKLKQGGEHDSP